MITIEVTGIQQLQEQLNKLSDIGTVVGPALIASAAELQTWVKEYPNKTIANQPHGLVPDRWYERGKGTHYITVDGKSKTYKTSQNLSKWGGMRKTLTPQLAQVVIGPRATYAPYVHDEERQVYFHALRGWRTAQAGISKFEPVIIRRITQAIDKVAKG